MTNFLLAVEYPTTNSPSDNTQEKNKETFVKDYLYQAKYTLDCLETIAANAKNLLNKSLQMPLISRFESKAKEAFGFSVAFVSVADGKIRAIHKGWYNQIHQIVYLDHIFTYGSDDRVIIDMDNLAQIMAKQRAEVQKYQEIYDNFEEYWECKKAIQKAIDTYNDGLPGMLQVYLDFYRRA